MSRIPGRGRGIPQSGIRAPCVPTSRTVQGAGQRPEMSGIRRPSTQQSLQRPEQRSFQVPISITSDRSRSGAVPRAGGLRFQRTAPLVAPQVCSPLESTRVPRTEIITPQEPMQRAPSQMRRPAQSSMLKAPSQGRQTTQASTLRAPSQMRQPVQASTLRPPSQMRPPAQSSTLRAPSQMRPTTAAQASMLRAPSQLRPSTVATDISTSRGIPMSSICPQPGERSMRREVRDPCREEMVIRPETRAARVTSPRGDTSRLGAIPKTGIAHTSALKVPCITVSPPDDSLRVSSIATRGASKTFRAGGPCDITETMDTSLIPSEKTRKVDLSTSRCIPRSDMSAGLMGRSGISRIERPSTQSREEEPGEISLSRGAEPSRLGAIPKPAASRIQRRGPQLSFQSQRSICPPTRTAPLSPAVPSTMSRILDPCAGNIPQVSSSLKQGGLYGIREMPESTESTTGMLGPGTSQAGERSQAYGFGGPSVEQSIRPPEARSMRLPSGYTSRLRAIPRTGGLRFPRTSPQPCPPIQSSICSPVQPPHSYVRDSPTQKQPSPASTSRGPTNISYRENAARDFRASLAPLESSPSKREFQGLASCSPTRRSIPSPGADGFPSEIANICNLGESGTQKSIEKPGKVSILSPSSRLGITSSSKASPLSDDSLFSPIRGTARSSPEISPLRRIPRLSLDYSPSRRSPQSSIVCPQMSPQSSIDCPQTQRSPQSSIVYPQLQRSPQSSIVCPQRSPQSSIVCPQLQRSPQSSIVCPQRSPQSSIVCPQLQRSPQSSIVCPQRSPQSSIVCPEPERSPQSSIVYQLPQRSPKPSLDALPVCTTQVPALDPVSKDSEQKVEEEGKEPEKYTLVQLRGSSKPKWFPGCLCAFPDNVYLGPNDSVVKKANFPEEVLFSAWFSVSPDSFPCAN